MTKAEVTTEALKAAPPVAISGATLLGFPMNDWVLWATLVYLVVGIGHTLTRWVFLILRRKNEQ